MNIIISASLLFLLSILGAVFVNAGTNEAGIEFLEENKNKDGVITLASGLQYKGLTKGKGLDHPNAETSCSCHYEGKLLDGTIFDSSYERGSPTSFAPNQVIKGWTEAMQLMVVGDKWEMYIPSELGYGDGGSPPKIGGGDVLIFIMEILAIEGDGVVSALRCSITDPKEECNEREQTYITKVTEWEDDNKSATEFKRIQGLLGKQMKDELRDWAKRRTHILQQFITTTTTTSTATESSEL